MNQFADQRFSLKQWFAVGAHFTDWFGPLLFKDFLFAQPLHQAYFFVTWRWFAATGSRCFCPRDKSKFITRCDF